jgi:nitrogen fixation/metabolism regulation signal transduction histidine kinase
LQLKIVFFTLLVATLVLITNINLVLIGLRALYSEAGDGTVIAIQRLDALLFKGFGITTLLALPLAAAIGITYSFKFCGPIYRFQKYFGGLKDGRWDQPCRLRKGDDLQDLNTAINDCLDQMRRKLSRQNELLAEARSILQASSSPPDAQSVAALLARIETEAADFARRTSVTAPAVQAPAAAAERVPVEAGAV